METIKQDIQSNIKKAMATALVVMVAFAGMVMTADNIMDESVLPYLVFISSTTVFFVGGFVFAVFLQMVRDDKLKLSLVKQ